MADSDRRWPDGPIKETAKKILLVNEARVGPHHAHVLRVRTAEHLFPEALLRRIKERRPEVLETLDSLAASGLLWDGQNSGHCDLKGTTRYRKFVTAKGPEREHLAQALKDRICHVEKTTKCVGAECRECQDECPVILRGLGGKILDIVVEEFANGRPIELAHLLGLPGNADLESIGGLVFAFGCCGARRAA